MPYHRIPCSPDPYDPVQDTSPALRLSSITGELSQVEVAAERGCDTGQLTEGNVNGT